MSDKRIDLRSGQRETTRVSPEDDPSALIRQIAAHNVVHVTCPLTTPRCFAILVESDPCPRRLRSLPRPTQACPGLMKNTPD